MKLPIGFFHAAKICQARMFGMPTMRLRHALKFGVFLLLININPVTAAETVSSVDAIDITVSDMRHAQDFYTHTLPFKFVSDREEAGDTYEHLTGVFGLRMRIVQLQLGDEKINLIEYLAPRGRPVPIDSHSNDRWFQHIAIIVSDMDKAYAQLRMHDVEQVSPEPQRLPDWNPNAGGIKAFYFRDPDGHNLEILQFPDGKGESRWHQKNKLFLGIDHTAIATADTEASLHFYRDVLGFRVAGTSENYGIEQERLNNVFGARLRITSLRSQHGPAVELLEYLAPRSGRSMPADTKANDLWHWQIEVSSPDLDNVASQLRTGHYDFVSSGIIQMPANDSGFNRELMVRDPDGHALMLMAH
jgi:catechol 2,3-dioxygenase-like lactoylglutathione lyase family enzyme